jgi:GNAT superfamily N-acetyltransferase
MVLEMNAILRLAQMEDAAALEELIALSARVLQARFYSAGQIEAALGPVFGVDRQLIADGTYYVAEREGKIAGCGGWSKRKALFGGDRARSQADALMDPATDPARIRAFFIHPDQARRGIGKALLAACESAIIAAGFSNAELVATLAGEPLYTAGGYSVVERFEVPMSEQLSLPVVRMTKQLRR